MLPASRAAWVPVFMATPTSACASAGASFVPSPVMATRWPAACSSRMRLQLRFRRGLGHEVVHARLGGDGGGGQRVVAGDHHGADAHLAQVGEAFLDAALDHVLELHDASTSRPSATTSGVPPEREISSTALADGLRKAAAELVHVSRASRRPRPCGSQRAGWPSRAGKSTPLMRVWAVKGTNCACGSATSRPRRLNFSLASTTMVRPSGVSSASEASCAASARRSGVTPGAGMKRAWPCGCRA